MIRLQRPGIPQVLQRRAANATALLETAWQNREDLSVTGLYSHDEIKSSLRGAQHNKCAYCEARDVRSPGAVEHYRPTLGWQQEKSQNIQKPEYFWLAYEWSNLLFSCTMCNDGGHKGNLFPLIDPAARATPTSRDLTKEQPLLLNPYEDVPEEHIEWEDYIPRAKDGSERGRKTIEVFGLDRDTLLIDDRRSILEATAGAVNRAEQLQPDSVERLVIRRVLLAMLDGTEVHTAMIRASLGDRIRAL